MRDKVVIVTGASSGIGLACVKAFAQKGSRVVLASRSRERLDEGGAQLQAEGHQCLVVRTDVSREDDCRHLIEATIERFGRIDILINNAGLSMRANFKQVELSVLHRLMDVNFWGTVYCTRYALPHILRTKGSIVGICSVAGFIGLPGRTGYSASKFAMRGFLETIRNENLGHHLHVLIVAPGFTASNVRKSALTFDGTPQGSTPREEGKMMTADEVAAKICHAVRHRRNKLILTLVNGKLALAINKLFPKLIARVAYRKMLREPDSPIEPTDSKSEPI